MTIYTIVQMFVVSKILFFEEINTFKQQGCIRTVKNNTVKTFHVTKYFYFK